MKQQPFSFRKRLRSFKFAFAGIVVLLRDEHNSRIHIALTAVALLAACIFNVSSLEWCIILICIAMVLMAEAFNSALEALADLVMSSPHPLVKKAKDVAAAGVLFTALAAAAVGFIIFIPYILRLLH